MSLRLTLAEYAAAQARAKRAPGANLMRERLAAVPHIPTLSGVFSCVIPGLPIAKGRPRTGKGQTYTPEKTRAAEATVASVVELAGALPFAGPVRVELDFFLPIPARMPRKQVQHALGGAIRPTGKPDATNLAKLVEDAIQGHGPGKCFADDSQIAELIVRKWYGVEPRTMLKVMAL